MFNWNGFGIQLLTGMGVTIAVSLCALLLGLFLSICFTFIALIRITALSLFVSSITALIRGLPELLVLFSFYFGGSRLLSAVCPMPVQLNTFLAGVLALAGIFAAYATQVFRGAFQVIPNTQLESAQALGFSYWVAFIRILFPQAFKHALPGLGNLWLVLLKDSALVALIGLGDLMNKAQLAASTTQEPFKFYLIAAGLFLLLTSVSQLLLNRLSRTSLKI